MTQIHFDWPGLIRWADQLLCQPLPDEARVQVRQLLRLAHLESAHAEPFHIQTAHPTPPVNLMDWLNLDTAQLLAQVRGALETAPPAALDPCAEMVVPGCAFAACREGQLELAAAFLELMLHWQMLPQSARELADHLAFQQRPDGGCGYLNPLRPSPYLPGRVVLDFHLPVTCAVVRALAAHRFHTSRLHTSHLQTVHLQTAASPDGVAGRAG